MYFKCRYFLCFLLLLVLLGCEQNSPKEESYIQTQIGKQIFLIPKVYLDDLQPKPIDDAVAMQVMYPDLKPLAESSQTLWRKGEWYKNIDLNFYNRNTVKPLKELLKSRIERFEVYRVVGKEYELIYRTQNADNPKDWGELWIEDDNVSHIRCGKQTVLDNGNKTSPQCHHNFLWKDQFVDLGYDKRLLPHWKEIKTNVIRILEGFEVAPEGEQ